MVYRGILILSLVFSVLLFCREENNPVSSPAGPTELECVWSGYSDLDSPPYPILRYSFSNDRIIATRDTCTNQGTGACNVEIFRGTFAIDTSASPKTIDIHIDVSPIATWVGETIHAIYYKFANNMNMSANEPGTDRPVSQSPPLVDPPIIHFGQ